ncbi:hypothetical protein FNX48_007285, partial [Streptomyces sp. IF17]|nr:hypothetical protein [Streptomyces alkaliphilus]
TLTSRPRLTVTPTAESGRGLPLVSLFADRWGTNSHPPTGKTVWAEVSMRTVGEEPAPVSPSPW